MTQPLRSAFAATGILLAAIAVAGCSRPADPFARNRMPDDIPSTRAVSDNGESAAEAGRAPGNTAPEAWQDARFAAQKASEDAANKVNDARISITVKAALAKDPGLSVSRIDVDTVGGRVALQGAAPDEAARARATQLASTVEGVVSVENQLTVETGRM